MACAYFVIDSENLKAYGTFSVMVGIAEVAQPGRAPDSVWFHLRAKLKTGLSPVQTRPSALSSIFTYFTKISSFFGIFYKPPLIIKYST